MSHSLGTEQWNQLLSLLSLDAVLPLYGDMGVPVPVGEKKQFQALLRQVILQARSDYEARPSSVPDVSAMLLGTLDRWSAADFEKWASGVFLGYHADQPEWSAWDIIFLNWAYSHHQDLEVLPVEKRNEFISGYRKMVSTDDVKQKCQALSQEPLSAWDLEIFGRRGYGSSWESGPFHVVESIARIERLKRFARQFWRALSLSEINALEQKARALIRKLKVWMPAALPRLDELMRNSHA